MEYAAGVTKASTGIMNADQQGTDMATLCHQETPSGAPHGTQCQIWFNHSLSAWRKFLQRAIKGPNAYC